MFFDRQIEHAFYGFVTQCTFKFKCFQKTRLNAESTRAGNQKIDLLFRLAALNSFYLVCIVKLTDNDV